MKTALITGITGQTGSHLAEFLLSRDYRVHGIIRRSSSINTRRIDHIFDRLELHYGDMTDFASLNSIIWDVGAQEIYNLAGQSHVRTSFEVPLYTAQAVAIGTLNLLEAVKHDYDGERIYQASSSEMFGSSPAPQNEQTEFRPESPYGVSKLFGYWNARNYREAYDMHITNGILFNHEGPRRGETFVSRKITRAVARIHHGLQQRLVLGNLDAKRDWGYAPEYAEAMYLMLQQDHPDDFVIATGEMHTVQEFVEKAFDFVHLKWYDYVDIDKKYFRPNEVNELQGDASRAKRILGWEPKVKFDKLVEIMMKADLEAALHER